MKSPTPEAQCAKGVFQIKSPTCGVYFPNKISILQVRVNKMESELDSAFETSLPLTSRTSPSIILKTGQDLFSSVSPTMAREIFQIHTVQITGKFIYETFPPSLHDLIIRPHVKQSSHKFAQKSLFPMKSLFKRKKSSHTFWRHCTLSSYLLPFLKASSLTSSQTIAFQSKTTQPLCF